MPLQYKEVRRLSLAPGSHPRGLSFLSAASGLVRVQDRLYVVADDELHLGVFDVHSAEPLGGFTNGEIAKTSGANPTFYRARLFVRHTIGLGGEPTKAESAVNQLASTYDSRRVVLTVGNVSLLDIFDSNSYAHDPRTKFMNRVLMIHGAYDYAADSRGYTNGVAAEYFDSGWILRSAASPSHASPTS